MIADLLRERALEELALRLAFIESECACAIALQDYGYLDRLVVIEREGVPPAVASWL